MRASNLYFPIFVIAREGRTDLLLLKGGRFVARWSWEMESCCTMNAPRTLTRAQAALQADCEQSINLRQAKTRQEKELAAESKRVLLRE